jgi:hypothetical protein
MNVPSSKSAKSDEKLFSSLLGEVHSFQEALDTLEGESVSLEDVIGLVSGIQRDIVQLYRATQT